MTGIENLNNPDFGNITLVCKDDEGGGEKEILVNLATMKSKCDKERLKPWSSQDFKEGQEKRVKLDFHYTPLMVVLRYIYKTEDEDEKVLETPPEEGYSASFALHLQESLNVAEYIGVRGYDEWLLKKVMENMENEPLFSVFFIMLPEYDSLYEEFESIEKVKKNVVDRIAESYGFIYSVLTQHAIDFLTKHSFAEFQRNIATGWTVDSNYGYKSGFVAAIKAYNFDKGKELASRFTLEGFPFEYSQKYFSYVAELWGALGPKEKERAFAFPPAKHDFGPDLLLPLSNTEMVVSNEFKEYMEAKFPKSYKVWELCVQKEREKSIHQLEFKLDSVLKEKEQLEKCMKSIKDVLEQQM